MKMHFETHPQLGVIHVEESRLDASVAIQFKDQFREMTKDCDTDVVLNLETVDFLDSSGLGAVVAARKLVGQGRMLELAGLRPAVSKVMTLTRMNSIFPIHESIDAALSARGMAQG